ncbi:MAG: sodium:proton antiporter NhaD [Bacteroidales bacterium]|nr:sodium:proton antiporter NhaD [Candidatus Colimorpha onthohippi]
MLVAIVATFIVGYACIALEHPLKINKTATALLLGVLVWTLYAFAHESFAGLLPEGETWTNALTHHLGSTAEIVFFLLGAMTIVTLVDQYQGFSIITDRIKTRNKRKLLWSLSIITFFLSAVLDNMTTAIVMVALLRKLIPTQKDRWVYAGMVILAANAGGAWSPIGDVTTIMLWIAGQVTTVNIMVKTFIASFVCMVVPIVIICATPAMKGDFGEVAHVDGGIRIDKRFQNLIFFVGIGLLIFVPIFKTITHLPPYLGMLFGVAVLWVLTEILSRKHSKEEMKMPTAMETLTVIDTPSILFFLGILMAVACLETCGALGILSKSLNDTFMGIHAGDEPIGFFIIDLLIGVISSVVDNVPLVAASMGMYPITGDEVMFATNHPFWEFLAYCAGTGGSLLIIGSAAGVAVMGMEKIDFIWYLKNISWLALAGYIAGAIVFILMDVTLFENIAWLRDLA